MRQYYNDNDKNLWQREHGWIGAGLALLLQCAMVRGDKSFICLTPVAEN
ncbi:hypothetical protein [Yoonia sp.]